MADWGHTFYVHFSRFLLTHVVLYNIIGLNLGVVTQFHIIDSTPERNATILSCTLRPQSGLHYSLQLRELKASTIQSRVVFAT